ncbi:MAG: ATP-binding cassette domain-containing protein [Trueperaceae bacterium]|nr:ATP-binding cassette domain-containing protein [Trueperaceae bacterium]
MSDATTRTEAGENPPPPSGTPHVELRGLVKRFGGVVALRGVDLDIHRGEVLGLVGDNGAGKSTLIKVLTGVHPADGGTVRLNGTPVEMDHPDRARELGIETIYQDLALVPTFDLPSNFFLGRELTRSFLGGLITVTDKARMRDVATRVVRDQVGLAIGNPYAPAATMSGGQRQAVAIGRALYEQAELVIMDEPTAALGVEEQDKVLDIIRRLKADGVTIVMISHTLDHVFAVADRIAVMHNGTLGAVRATADATRTEIVGLIMGSHLHDDAA